MTSTYQKARASGVSDEEILEHFAAKDPKVREQFQQATAAGISPEESFGYLEKKYSTQQPKEKKSFYIGKDHPEYEPIYKGLGDIASGFASGISFGATEQSKNFPELQKPTDENRAIDFEIGRFVGENIPIIKGFKLAYKGINYLKNLSLWGKRVAKTGAAGTIMGTATATKQVIKGEFEPSEIAKEAAIGATIDVLFRGAFKGYEWLKTLTPSQKTQFIVEGTLPRDLSPSQFTEFQNEIVPMIQRNAQEQYQIESQKVFQAHQENYQAKLAEAQQNYQNLVQENEAQFQKAISETNLENIKSKEDYEVLLKNTAALHEEELYRATQEYKDQLRILQQQHESELLELQKINQNIEKEFVQANDNFKLNKSIQDSVKDVLEQTPVIPERFAPIEVRIAPESNITQRPEPLILSTEKNLSNEVGNIVSPNRIVNTTDAGLRNMEAVRATDNVMYENVNKAYQAQREANAGISQPQFYLVNNLLQTRQRLLSIPALSPPEKQLLDTVNKILEKSAVFDEAGQIVDYLPVDNQILLDQAKSLRYSQDWDFEHANIKGILNPTIKQLQEAASISAQSAGRVEAIEADKTARETYKRWAELFDNDYIRPYRNVNNFDYSKTFKSSLNTDEFNQLNNVLSLSNEGQQLANQTRRELVNKQLDPFYSNPRKINPQQLDETLRELQPILNPGEEQQIRHALAEARRRPVIKGKKQTIEKMPEKKEKKIIESVTLPKRKPQKTFVKIPKAPTPKELPERKTLKPFEAPEPGEVKESPLMKSLAKKINITEEEAIKLTNSIDGLRELKDLLGNTPKGKQLYERATAYKLRNMFQKGRVRHKWTGDELYEVINKEENFNILSEIIGERDAQILLDAAAETAEKEVSKAKWKKLAKSAGMIKLSKIIGIF